MSAWRCSKENWLQLAKDEILEFLDQCCFEGRPIGVLSLFADSGRHHKFFQDIGLFATTHDLSVNELIFDNRDAELSDVFGVVETFKVEGMTVMVKGITLNHFDVVKKFPLLCTRFCTFKLNEVPDEETLDVIENRLNCFEELTFNVQPNELVYKKLTFWDIQRNRMRPHKELEELKITITTRDTFFSNVCVAIRICQHPEEKVHYLQSNMGCLVGDPDDMSTWSTAKNRWLDQAHVEIAGFLRMVFWNHEERCSSGKTIKKLTLSSDSGNLHYQNLLKKIRKELIESEVKIQEMSLENPEPTLLENLSIVEGIQFVTGSMNHSSAYDMLELERGITKLNESVKRFTVFYENLLSEDEAENLGMQDFEAHVGDVPADFGSVVITRKPENQVRHRRVPEVVVL